MQTVLLPQVENATFEISSGPGAPMFDQTGPQTRIMRAPVRAIGAMRFEDGKEIYGQVLDISDGGCLFRTESTISLGAKFEMRITILRGNQRAVADISGEIRRVTDSEGRKAYGCAFIAENSEDRRSHKWLYTQALR